MLTFIKFAMPLVRQNINGATSFHKNNHSIVRLLRPSRKNGSSRNECTYDVLNLKKRQ